MITALAQRRSHARFAITAPRVAPPRAPAAAAAAPLAGRGAMVSVHAALAALVALLVQVASAQEEAAAALDAPLQQANATEPACDARCQKWVAIVEVLIVLGVGLSAVTAGFCLIHNIDTPTRFIGGAAAAERRPHQD